MAWDSFTFITYNSDWTSSKDVPGSNFQKNIYNFPGILTPSFLREQSLISSSISLQDVEFKYVKNTLCFLKFKEIRE